MKYDVIIIGAGITGLASAYHIIKGDPSLKILIVEKRDTICQGNTARAEGLYRDLFSNEVHFKMNHSTISFYKYIQEEKGIDLGMKAIGYLFLIPESSPLINYFKEISTRAELSILSKEELDKTGIFRTDISPELKESFGFPNIIAGVLGHNCGMIDQEKVCNYYYEELKRMGVEFSFGTNVRPFVLSPKKRIDYPGEPLLWQEKYLESIETNKGKFSADTYIICTDVWATELLDIAGIDSHVRPRKRQVFQVTSPNIDKIIHIQGFNKLGLLPATIMPFSVYFKPDPGARSLWVSCGDELMRGFSLEDDPLPEEGFYKSSIFPVLSTYVPSLTESKIINSWAGYISLSGFDRMPIIFKKTNIIVATGTHGGGITKGDADGRVVAALYFGKKFATLYDGTKVAVKNLGEVDRQTASEKIGLSEYLIK